MSRRAVLIYNPTSGRQVSRRLLPQVLRELEAGGFSVEPAPTAGPGDATRLAGRAAADGYEVVFAMGGDGTLREAAAGLYGSETALGPLPAGTANVLALACGLPRQALPAARRLPGCRTREVDVGLAGGEPFLMMASCGLDAAVMARQSTGLKKILGPGAFGFAIARSFVTYDYPEIKLRSEGRVERATLAVAANIPFYGGSFRIAPDADFCDGRLDLVLFNGRGRGACLAFARDLLRGRHTARDDVTVRRVERVEILAPEDVPVQIDGDVLATRAPFVVELAPQRLRVLVV